MDLSAITTRRKRFSLVGVCYDVIVTPLKTTNNIRFAIFCCTKLSFIFPHSVVFLVLPAMPKEGGKGQLLPLLFSKGDRGGQEVPCSIL